MVMNTEESDTTNVHMDHYISTISDHIDIDPPIKMKSPLTRAHGTVPKYKRNKSREPEELQHLSEMTTSSENNQHTKMTNSSRTSSLSSVRIEIQDLGEESINFTTSTLRKCKQLVLKPYWWLLVFIGWRAFRKDTLQSQRKRWYVLNVIYTTTIILLLLYTYSYEIMACEWKLDVDRDTQPPTVLTTPTTTPQTTTLNGSLGILNIGPASKHVINETTIKPETHSVVCDHILTSYIIPNLLHLVAYIMGLYYFRIQENEQLYALMEKVFLQATPIEARSASQHKMIVKLRLFLAVGCVWVFLTVLLQWLYVYAFDFPKLASFQTFEPNVYWITFGIELIGRTIFNSVILAIVMNFATQCEMVKFYVRGLTMRLQEKSTDLKTAMKDILMLRQSLGILNGIISKMTSLAAFILAELTCIGVFILLANQISKPTIWIYRAVFPVVWASMLAFPLFQAARVNSICLRIRKIAIEMRVFGYKGASILDLDSFLQFAMITKLKAKLLHMPIQPAHLIFTVILSAFVILVLLQTNSISTRDVIF